MRLAFVAAGLVLTAAGCASISRGTTNQVQIMSNPPQAEVRLSNGMICVTPCTLTIGRKDEFVATVSKQGFETREVAVKTRASSEGVGAGVLGNMLVVGGLVGVVVDASSGAMLEHCPNPLAVNLRPLDRKGVPQGEPHPDPAEKCIVKQDPAAAPLPVS